MKEDKKEGMDNQENLRSKLKWKEEGGARKKGTITYVDIV